MYLLAIIIFCALAYFIYSKNDKSKPNIKSKNTISTIDHGMNFLPPIPTGYQIFANNVPIAGIQHRKDAALNFAKSSDQELQLEREPSNTHDSNAIKLIGVSSSGNYLIGYLPKELSAQIVGTELFESVKARLGRIYLSNTNFLDIQYQIIGPKNEKKKFDDFLSSKPADSNQKEYYAYFGLPIPKGLTAGQAELAIIEHRKTTTTEERDEWDDYSRILEEFDDKDFREGYDLKKVSRTVLLDAMNRIKQEDKLKNYKYLYLNIDEVVEKILEIKPDLEK